MIFLEELIAILPKLAEIGGLGLISVLLIWKGVPAMNKLSESNIQLANAIGKLTDSVNNRLEIVEHDLRDIKSSLETLLRRFEYFEKSRNN